MSQTTRIIEPRRGHRSDTLGHDLARFALKMTIMFDFADSWRKVSAGNGRKVGCVLFDPRCTVVYGFGYNGPASGFPHGTGEAADVPCACSVVVGLGGKSVGRKAADPSCQACGGKGVVSNATPSGDLHAEINTFMKADLRSIPRLSAVMYCYCPPCHPCAKYVVNSGVVGLFVEGPDPYDKADRELLAGNGIAVVGHEVVRAAAAGALDDISTTRLRTIFLSLLSRGG